MQLTDTGDGQSLPAALEQAEVSLVAIREPAARELRPESGIKEVATDATRRRIRGKRGKELLRSLRA